MLNGIKEIIKKHIKNNINIYFFLMLAFLLGISAGAFTVNGLSAIQREELNYYFKGFIQLLDNQKVDSSELLRVSFYENAKFVVVLWVLGVTIIGIPFIYILIAVRGFISGFTSGLIIKCLGFKGVVFNLLALLPKEFIIVPCIIALGVSGINFSLEIIKKKSLKHISKESLKSGFAAYCLVTLLFMSVICVGVLMEAYVTPVFIRLILPFINN